jgi:hypothetical protein
LRPFPVRPDVGHFRWKENNRSPLTAGEIFVLITEPQTDAAAEKPNVFLSATAARPWRREPPAHDAAPFPFGKLHASAGFQRPQQRYGWYLSFIASAILLFMTC